MQETQRYGRLGQPQARKVRHAAPNPRRPVNWRRRITLVILVILTLLIIGAAFLAQRAIAFNDAVSTQSAFSMRLFGPFSPERVNVLLLGYSDESRDGAYLSDSMNLISVDKERNTASLIAIPRDLWVEGIPEVPQNMKINEAFRIGYYDKDLQYGAHLAAKAVTRVTGLEVDGWLSLDFQGFQQMVDAVGGITLMNPREFEYTWDEQRYHAGQFRQRFEKGILHLNGKRALEYARSRYTSKPEESSDFARSIRQQRVLTALRSKVGLDDLERVTEAVRDHLHTNLSVIDLAMLAGQLQVDERVEMREGDILEATTNTEGQYILVVVGQATTTDYEPLHRYIEEALSEPLPTTSSSASASATP